LSGTRFSLVCILYNAVLDCNEVVLLRYSTEVEVFTFYARKQLLLSERLSHRNSVCPLHGWISQKRCKL